MNDREMLELAAKAAGMSLEIWGNENETNYQAMPSGDDWNPLTDDGEALRLAVKCNLLVDCFSGCARPLPDSIGWQEGTTTSDPCEDIRYAIVRAAAEIGRAMP